MEEIGEDYVVQSAIGSDCWLVYIWIKWIREMIKDLGFPEWVERPTLTLTDDRNSRDWANDKMITDIAIDTLIDGIC